MCVTVCAHVHVCVLMHVSVSAYVCMCVLARVCAHVLMPAIWKGALVEEAEKEAEVIVTHSDSLSGNLVTEV